MSHIRDLFSCTEVVASFAFSIRRFSLSCSNISGVRAAWTLNASQDCTSSIIQRQVAKIAEIEGICLTSSVRISLIAANI